MDVIMMPAAERWATLMMAGIVSLDDPRTLAAWARAAGTSAATLRSRCRAAGLSPKHSLDLARALRAIHTAERLGCRPDDLLDMDPRTIRRLLPPGACPCVQDPGRSLPAFLASQTLVADLHALDALRRAYSFGALLVLALLAGFVPAAAESEEDACFSACYVMEVGCARLGGIMYASCTYNPYLPSNERCRLPGCYCSTSVDGYCGDEPLMLDGG